jgi:hypothetical protein
LSVANTIFRAFDWLLFAFKFDFNDLFSIRRGRKIVFKVFIFSEFFGNPRPGRNRELILKFKFFEFLKIFIFLLIKLGYKFSFGNELNELSIKIR